MRLFLTGSFIDVQFLSQYLRDDGRIQVLTLHRTKRDMYQKYKSFGFFKKAFTSDITHIISIKPNGRAGLFWILIFLVLKLLRKKTILHWQGTDVLELSCLNAHILSKIVDHHLSYAPWLSDELKAKGVESQWLPIIPPPNTSFNPLPDNLTVLVYLGDKQRNIFYGDGHMKSLIKILTDVEFIVLGEVEEKHTSPNVSYFGKVDYEKMDEIYSMSTVLLRLTEHDGLSFMVLEALSRGRYVIWSKPFPHCFHVECFSDVLTHLKSLKGATSLNNSGIQFVKENFNVSKCVNNLLQVYGGLLER